MSIIREHALERFWLERRLELLNYLDNFAEQVFYNDDEDNDVINEDSSRIKMLENHYRDVMNPYDVAETIKKIYPPHQYGPAPKKRKPVSKK